MNRGFIQLIIIVIMAVVILSLLGVSISAFVNNSTLRDNFAYLWSWLTSLWNNFAGQYFWQFFNFVRSKV